MTHVTYERAGAVGLLTMHRPPANSYESGFVHDLDAAVEAAEADAGCKVVIVRSAVKGFFCGGADIKQFKANTPAQNIETIAFAQETLNKLMRSQRIYIAEVSGHALGGGLEIALACDLRFAAQGTYRVGLPEVTLGILPGNGGTQRLPAITGIAKAMELMITGQLLQPAEAHQLGIFNRLIEPDQLEAETRGYAEQLAAGAIFAIGQIKRAVYDGYRVAAEAGYAVERANIARLFRSEDAKEGFAAFVEKRKPQFTGR
jgi:enoyl-CoA hydratase/carnithine racemase